jgi:toxin-antitoxin system PIN domain toxin
LDANVWLALAAEAHAHHDRAQAFWSDKASEVAAFCPITQLAFLRHLTNKTIMGEHCLTPRAAWAECRNFLALPEVKLLPELPGLTEQLGRYIDLGRTSANLWTDAYLAAFAKCAGLRLVSFDTVFSAFAGLEVLTLEPSSRKTKQSM